MSNIDVVQEREKRQQRIMTDAFLDALEEHTRRALITDYHRSDLK